MEIVKELNLNKNPKQYKNNSMFFAKNVKLDENGSNIVRDTGTIPVKAIADLSNEYDSIRGCFATINELICFMEVTENGNSVLKIYRYDETTEKIIIYHTDITYDENYKISFDYLYNNGGELIISFCLYKNVAEDKDVTKLKSINLGEFNQMILSRATSVAGYDNVYEYRWANSNENLQYIFNINHNVPFCQCKSEIISSKDIICGVYQFFIRYEISTFGESRNEYTKWFPIGKELYAINLEEIEIYNHYFKGNVQTTSNDPSLHEQTVLTRGDFTVNNVTQKASNSFKLKLSFESIPSYNSDIIKYQIGYACKHDDAIDYRMWLLQDINNFENVDIIFDDNVLLNKNILTADDVTDSVFDLYNVKNIINKQNRLYIANYKENDNVNLSDKVNNITYSYNTDSEFDGIDYYVSSIKGVLQKTASGKTTNYDFAIYERGLSNLTYLGLLTNIGFFPSRLTQDLTATINDTTQNLTKTTTLSKILVRYNKENKNFTLLVEEVSYSINSTVTVTYDNVEQKFEITSVNLDNIQYKGTSLNENVYQTLYPSTAYNFYIHFVKANGYYTDGYRISPTNTGDGRFAENKNHEFFKITPQVYDKKIGVSFNNIVTPVGYAGFFISYEKPEYFVKYEAYVQDESSRNNTITVNVTEVKLLLSHWKSQSLSLGIYDDNTNTIHTYAISKTLYRLANSGSDNRGLETNIELTFSDADYANIKPLLEANKLVYLIDKNYETQSDKFYTNTIKTLIRLTDVISSTHSNVTDELCDFNYDSFYCFVNDIVFRKPTIISETGEVYQLGYVSNNRSSSVINSAIGLITYEGKQYVNIINYTKYSFYNLNAISLKIKPNNKVTVLDNDHIFLCVYYAPSDLIDLFQLKSEYINKNNIKTYTNYIDRPGTSTIFDNTIRRSDVYGDEAYSNAWKNFRATQYKTILDKKGKITKLVSLSNNIIIHKEGSLFILDADNKLQAINRNINLASIDLFELDAKEIISSDNGRCGLAKINHSIVTDLGYVFYSEYDKKIYSFGSKLTIISQSIDYILKNYDVDNCYLASDIEENRLLICLYVKATGFITLSYNLITNTFVSLHDMYFRNAVTTNRRLYYWNSSFGIYKYSKESYSYDMMAIANDDIFWQEYNNNVMCSIIDVVCNYDYEKVKQLESIVYSLYQLGEIELSKYQANNAGTVPYPGFKILIYSDDCATEENDISDMTNGKALKINNAANPNSYKYPTLDRGMWHYNYFRNIKSDIYHYNDTDNKSLIYGKYIVIRFIIPNDVNFRLETLQFNIN